MLRQNDNNAFFFQQQKIFAKGHCTDKETRDITPGFFLYIKMQH